MPEAAPLALLRTDIDQRPHRLKCVLMEPGIRKEVLGGMPKDEKKAVKAFLSQNSESALKTKPKVRTEFSALLTGQLFSAISFTYHDCHHRSSKVVQYHARELSCETCDGFAVSSFPTSGPTRRPAQKCSSRSSRWGAGVKTTRYFCLGRLLRVDSRRKFKAEKRLYL